MFFVTKEQLKSLLKFAGKNENRKLIMAVRFERDENGKPVAVSTDGHRLLVVKLKSFDLDNVPVPDGFKKLEPIESVTVPRETLETAVKSIQKSSIPILETVIVGKKFLQVCFNRFPYQEIESFPVWKSVLDINPVYKISVNQQYLKDIPGKTGVTFEFDKDGTGPVKFDGDGFYGVIMPMVKNGMKTGLLVDMESRNEDIKEYEKEKLEWELEELRKTLREYVKENRRLREIIAAQPKKAKKTGKRRINRTLETTLTVLKKYQSQFPNGMIASKIVEKARECNLWTPNSKTPANSVYSRVLEDIKRNPETTRFRIESGLISLK